MSHAHLLLQVEPGTAGRLADDLAELPAVRGVCLTTGAYDVIVELDVRDDSELSRTVATVRRADGLSVVCVCRAA